MAQRVGGLVSLQANGVIYSAKGNFEYNTGRPKRSAVISSGGKLAGYKEEGQVGFVAGKITDRGDLDTDALQKLTDATVTLELANGKVLVWRNAYYAAEGTGSTEEGEFDFRFEGEGEEIR